MLCAVKEIRRAKGLTQKDASLYTGIPLRTYKEYENNKAKEGSIKYNYILSKLEKYGFVDEENGIVDIDTIKSVCSDIFSGYDIKYAILFGSYAKGTPGEKSDIDILISDGVSGLNFFGLNEKLRENLHKKIDLLDIHQLSDNTELLDEILKYGVRIYG